jgi:hypothetical protein
VFLPLSFAHTSIYQTFCCLGTISCPSTVGPKNENGAAEREKNSGTCVKTYSGNSQVLVKKNVHGNSLGTD